MTPDQLKSALHGIVGIAITPMTADRSPDEKGWRGHLRFLVENGINGSNGVLVTTGSTGECGALSVSERKHLLEVALDEVGGDVPIIAGCNHSDVYQVIDLARHAAQAGAAGIMIVPPYYYVPTDDVILDFYRKVSEQVDIGIFLYNNIEVTHKDVPLPVLADLASNSNVVGIKECTPDFIKMEQVARYLGDKIAVVNGHGEFLEPFAALAGTAGFISSTCNFAPRLTVEMWEARSTGNYTRALEIRRQLTPYLDLAKRLGALGGEPRVLSVIKKAASMVSRCQSFGRLPLRDLTEEDSQEVAGALRAMGLV